MISTAIFVERVESKKVKFKVTEAIFVIVCNTAIYNIHSYDDY